MLSVSLSLLSMQRTLHEKEPVLCATTGTLWILKLATVSCHRFSCPKSRPGIKMSTASRLKFSPWGMFACSVLMVISLIREKISAIWRTLCARRQIRTPVETDASPATQALNLINFRCVSLWGIREKSKSLFARSTALMEKSASFAKADTILWGTILGFNQGVSLSLSCAKLTTYTLESAWVVLPVFMICKTVFV